MTFEKGLPFSLKISTENMIPFGLLVVVLQEMLLNYCQPNFSLLLLPYSTAELAFMLFSSWGWMNTIKTTTETAQNENISCWSKPNEDGK